MSCLSGSHSTEYVHRSFVPSTEYFPVGVEMNTAVSPANAPHGPGRAIYLVRSLICPSAQRFETSARCHITACLTLLLQAHPTLGITSARSHTTLLLRTEWVSGEYEDIGSRGALHSAMCETGQSCIRYTGGFSHMTCCTPDSRAVVPNGTSRFTRRVRGHYLHTSSIYP
jgi:hypothetical protein